MRKGSAHTADTWNHNEVMVLGERHSLTAGPIRFSIGQGYRRAEHDYRPIQAFTSYSNPKGNADTERLMRTLKAELVWINEFTSPSIFLEALDTWPDAYNANYLHSSLGYRSPEVFEAEYLSRETLLADAC